jgi:hypothetical protein
VCLTSPHPCYAMRLRWEWLARTDPTRLCAGMPCQAEQAVRTMFKVSMTAELATVCRRFWHDRCTDGQYVANIAPELLQAVNHHHARKTIIAGLRTSPGR